MQKCLGLLLLFAILLPVGCGTPAPLVALKARWFDVSDPYNAKPIVDATNEKLRAIPRLQLDLGGNGQVKDEDLVSIEGLPNLVHLDLYDTAITDKGLQSVARLPALEILDLNRTSVSDEGMSVVGKIYSLKRLELAGVKISDAGVRRLSNLPLFRIDLSATGVTNDGLEDIAKIAGLERLHVQDTQVSDDGLAHVGTIKSLQELGLYRSGAITDSGLRHLHNLKQLRALFLGDSKYSPAGLAELRLALPNCDIAAN